MAMTTTIETSSGRRQPLRSTRMTLTRTTSGLREEEEEPPKPGFLPGITHFTDAINALPKEVQRHSTMLKEVDAKIYAIENDLRAIAHIEPPTSTASSGKDDAAQRYYENAVHVMASMLVSLDEKNIVLSTANEALDKLLARCDSAWPLIEQEISEETRWGRLDHWAYTDKSADKKPAANTERASRRNNEHDRNITTVVTDVVASKSSKNQKRLNQDTIDAEDGSRKTGSQKRKPNDSIAGATGLGLSNVAVKKRKLEKPFALPTNGGGHIMEKSISSVFRNMPGSPTTGSGGNAKKNQRIANGAANGRKRAGTAASNTGSPMMASSPIISSFALSGKGGFSPAAGTLMVRTTSSRRGGGPTSNPIQSTRPASAASTPLLNGHSYPDEKPPLSRMSSGFRGDDLGNGDSEHRSSSRKREDAQSRPRPPSISTATRNNGKASKTSTPVVGTFPDASRPRSGRNSTTTLNAMDLLPPKRSHKKKEPAALQRQRSQQKVGRTRDDDDSEDADDMEEHEQLYCYCNGPSHGEMVACDMPGCEKEWFHLECVGLSKPPSTKTKWFCPTCKQQRAGLERMPVA